MHCGLMLNGQSKWLASIANSFKTAILNKDDGGDPNVPTQYGLAPAKNVTRNRVGSERIRFFDKRRFII